MSTGRVHAQVTLVTGAASGIGRATAILLAEEGATVILTDIDSHAVEQVAREIRDGGRQAEAMRLDVADETAFAEANVVQRGGNQMLRIAWNDHPPRFAASNE